MRLLAGSSRSPWLAVAVLALALSGVAQRYVEERRVAANLTWSDPEKHALEVGFLALGGFRGILADMLWIRAIRHQEAGRYYELKLLCDMILKLQPTFTQVHAFQAYNMSYNLAYKAEGPEDKWYWIRSGLMTLERGLERNYRNYSLWFELGFQYFDRFGESKAADTRELMQRELPNLDDLTEDERRAVFLHEEARKARWAREHITPRPPAPNEYLRYAAYYFWQAMQTNTDPTPLRTERVYGACIERLGYWHSKEKDPAKRTHWDDWGAEDWWVELRRRNEARGMPYEDTVPNHLKFCLYQQMDYYTRRAETERAAGKTAAAAELNAKALAAHEHFVQYFPNDNQTLEELLQRYRDYRARQTAGHVRVITSEPVEP
jgi:hypothetical protein